MCDYSDTHILVEGIITIARAGAGASARLADDNIKNFLIYIVSFADCINEINNKQVDKAKVLM